eukprot:TRINITY_DN1281_c0_g1_i1.p1 TRINITY_DN1281_c0_g1~~TRINITY_DN1281_c0_g1_i1.p1  ORF type:complete len:156 (+),score=49.31 TRINITY_DN1281_c0_g1_i1:178-645(+)
MAAFLTQDQVSEFREAFKMFDADKEGKITKNGLKTVMRNLGFKPTDAEVAQMIKDGDTSGKGSISFEEFLTMFEDKMKKMDSSDDLARAFECFDPFGKGFIPAKEFQNLMTMGGYAKFKDTEIKEIMRIGESDKGDGSIDYYSLVKAISGPAPSS